MMLWSNLQRVQSLTKGGDLPEAVPQPLDRVDVYQQHPKRVGAGAVQLGVDALRVIEPVAALVHGDTVCVGQQGHHGDYSQNGGDGQLESRPSP